MSEREQANIVYPDYKNNDVMQPPHQTLLESYLTQTNIVKSPDAMVALRPVKDGARTPGSFGFFANSETFVVSAWNPAGQPTTFADNRQRHKELELSAFEHGWKFEEMVVVGDQNAWFESALWIQDGTLEEIKEFARSFGQVAFLRIFQNRIGVFSVDDAFESVDLEVELEPLENPGCPMRLLNTQKVCKPEGGPWVHASQLVGAVWHHHREIALALHGCTVCSDGSQQLPERNGTPILLKQLYVGSRFNGYVFSDLATDL